MPACLPTAAAALAVVLLSACAGKETVVSCEDVTAYREAGSVGPLRVPDDLSVPDESEALRIPEPELGDPDLEAARCLELSPGFGDATIESSSDDD
jgi:hypothetical protein